MELCDQIGMRDSWLSCHLGREFRSDLLISPFAEHSARLEIHRSAHSGAATTSGTRAKLKI